MLLHPGSPTPRTPRRRFVNLGKRVWGHRDVLAVPSCVHFHLVTPPATGIIQRLSSAGIFSMLHSRARREMLALSAGVCRHSLEFRDIFHPRNTAFSLPSSYCRACLVAYPQCEFSISCSLPVVLCFSALQSSRSRSVGRRSKGTPALDLLEHAISQQRIAVIR